MNSVRLSQARKGEVRGLSRHPNGPEIPATAVEYLNAAHGGDIEPASAVDGHAVGDTLLARSDVAQLGKGPLVGDAAVGLHVIGVDGRPERVVEQQGLAVERERETVGADDRILDYDGFLAARRKVVDEDLQPGDDRAGPDR